jgi:hypothetical protein
MKRRAYARVCISCRSPRVVFAMHRSHSCCDVMQSLCTPPLHCACEEFTRHLFGMSMLPGAFPFAMRLVQLLWAGPHRHGRICTRRCGSICLSAIQVSRHVCRPRRLPNLVCPAFEFVRASVLFSAAMSHVCMCDVNSIGLCFACPPSCTREHCRYLCAAVRPDCVAAHVQLRPSSGAVE